MDLGSNMVTYEIRTNPLEKEFGGGGGGQGLICYHSATRHETSETILKNVLTLYLKKICFFSLHLFDSLEMQP